MYISAQVGRVNWTPTRCSRLWPALCQDYFDSSCFVTDPAVYQSVCFKPGRQRLKKSTLTCPIIPSIFKRIREIETKERRSVPFQKRRNLEISRSDSNTQGGKNIYQILAKYKVIIAQLRLVQILRKCPIYEWLL